MTSVSKTGSAERVLSPRVSELKKKIHDDKYLTTAIERIASVLSRNLVETRGVTGNSADFMLQ